MYILSRNIRSFEYIWIKSIQSQPLELSWYKIRNKKVFKDIKYNWVLPLISMEDNLNNHACPILDSNVVKRIQKNFCVLTNCLYKTKLATFFSHFRHKICPEKLFKAIIVSYKLYILNLPLLLVTYITSHIFFNVTRRRII